MTARKISASCAAKSSWHSTHLSTKSVFHASTAKHALHANSSMQIVLSLVAAFSAQNAQQSALFAMQTLREENYSSARYASNMTLRIKIINTAKCSIKISFLMPQSYQNNTLHYQQYWGSGAIFSWAFWINCQKLETYPPWANKDHSNYSSSQAILPTSHFILFFVENPYPTFFHDTSTSSFTTGSHHRPAFTQTMLLE